MRIEGWEKRLDEYIQEVSMKSFKWGECDCLIFVSDCCNVICGVDPMSKKKKSDPKTIRGKYKTEEKAKELIREYRRTMPNIMDIHFNRINPNFAQRGDVVMCKIQNMTFGIVWGGKAYFKTDNEGFVTMTLNKCKYAWRVE